MLDQKFPSLLENNTLQLDVGKTHFFSEEEWNTIQILGEKRQATNEANHVRDQKFHVNGDGSALHVTGIAGEWVFRRWCGLSLNPLEDTSSRSYRNDDFDAILPRSLFSKEMTKAIFGAITVDVKTTCSKENAWLECRYGKQRRSATLYVGMVLNLEEKCITYMGMVPGSVLFDGQKHLYLCVPDSHHLHEVAQDLAWYDDKDPFWNHKLTPAQACQQLYLHHSNFLLYRFPLTALRGIWLQKNLLL